jgi:16S rRNA (guanine1207-N2)-methyltransferase
MLAEQVEIPDGATVVHLNCGNGLAGAAAAASGRAKRVLLADRNIVSVEAARRTLAANHAREAEVYVGHGSQALPSGTVAGVVAIRIPVEKLALLQLIADAFSILSSSGRCYVAGANNEGIKTAARTLEKVFGNAGVVTYDSGHRIIGAVKRTDEPASPEELASPFLQSDAFNELATTLRGHSYTLFTRPGVFSWDHLDEATAVLAGAMQIEPGNSVLDLGCGSGALGVVAAGLSQTGLVTMVDADVEAIRSATRSAEAAGLANCRAFTSDVTLAVRDERFDVVVTNPPFHVGKATDLDVPLQFIQEAWEVLAAGGRLFLVANRTLPYERAIYQRFGNIGTLVDGQRFKVLTATK